MKEVKITNSEAGQRLDKFLLKYFNKATKSFIYKMLRKKRIKYNGARAQGNEIIKNGDFVQLYLAEETILGFMEEKLIHKTGKSFDVIYEDENIIICNKPDGLIVHPDKENSKNTLNDELLYYMYKKGEYVPKANSTFTPSVCNRLDRNTSGIILFGKNLGAVQALNSALKNNELDKYYITMVKGTVQKSGVLEGYHLKRKDNTVEIFESFVENSKRVVTNYKPIKVADGFTLLEIKLITGKSHQIRASLKMAGYPIVGDRKYGDEGVNKAFKEKYGLENQFLHAYKLVFKQKEGIFSYLFGKEFCAPCMKKMQNILTAMELM